MQEGAVWRGAEVRPAMNAGLGVFATKRLAAGDVLLEETACVMGLLPKFWQFCCRWCMNLDLSRAEPLSWTCKCGCCRWCSERCRDADFRHNDAWCAAEARLAASRARLAAAKMPQDEVAFLESVSLMAVMDDDFGLGGQRKAEADASVVAWVRELSGMLDLSEDRIMHLAAVEQINAMSITNQTPMGPLGVGRALFRNGSRFNHSCWPNVCRVRCNNVMKFVVVRPVEKGDQLCICYVPPRLANKVCPF